MAMPTSAIQRVGIVYFAGIFAGIFEENPCKAA